MQRQIAIVLLLFIARLAFSQDSINSEQLSGRTLQTDVPKIHEIETDFSDPNAVQILDLGNVLCGSHQHVALRIKSKLQVPTHLPRRTFSCGCIKNLPQSLSFTSKGETLLEFDLEVGRREEEVFQNIAYWNAAGEPLLQIQIKLLAITPLVLLDKSIVVVSEDRQQVEVAVRAGKPDVEMNQLIFQALAPEIESVRLEHANQTYKLVFDIDPSKCLNRSTSYTCELMVSSKNGTSCTAPIAIQFPNRTVISPNPVLLRTQGSETLGRVMIFSRPLRKLLDEDNSKVLQGNLKLTKSDKLVAMDFAIGEITSNDHALTIINLRTTSDLIAQCEPILYISYKSWNVAVPFVNSFDLPLE